MKYIFLFLLITSCLFTSAIKGQSINIEVGYSGGPTSLGNDIYRYLNVTSLIIESDYLLFFEVSLNSKGKITTIKAFHLIEDSIAKRVYEALSKTSKWKNTTKATQKVLVPVFLIRDKEDSPITNSRPYSMTSKDYLATTEFVKGYFLSPIIITFFYGPGKKSMSIHDDQ